MHPVNKRHSKQDEETLALYPILTISRSAKFRLNTLIVGVSGRCTAIQLRRRYQRGILGGGHPFLIIHRRRKRRNRRGRLAKMISPTNGDENDGRQTTTGHDKRNDDEHVETVARVERREATEFERERDNGYQRSKRGEEDRRTK